MRENKGFTLIEVVVTLGLVGILLSAVATLFPQWLDQYLFIKQMAQATEIMDVLASGLDSELQFSTDRIVDEKGLNYVVNDRIGCIPATEDDCSVSVAGEVVTITGQPDIYGSVFDSGFYGDMSVDIKLDNKVRSRDNAKIIEADIIVYSSEGAILCSDVHPILLYNEDIAE